MAEIGVTKQRALQTIRELEEERDAALLEARNTQSSLANHARITSDLSGQLAELREAEAKRLKRLEVLSDAVQNAGERIKKNEEAAAELEQAQRVLRKIADGKGKYAKLAREYFDRQT